MQRPKFLLQRQGTTWIAAAPGFLDPSENAVGRGSTQSDAIADLSRQPEFQAWLRERKLPNPELADFEVRTGVTDLTFVDARGTRHGTNAGTE